MPYAMMLQDESSFVPRLDAVGPLERLAVDQPLVAAYLGGRPVVLAQTDPSVAGRTQRTIPVTISRLRHAIDIERGRDGSYEPSLVDDWPLSHVPIGIGADAPVVAQPVPVQRIGNSWEHKAMRIGIGAVPIAIGAAIGAYTGEPGHRLGRAAVGAVIGVASLPLLALGLVSLLYAHQGEGSR